MYKHFEFNFEWDPAKATSNYKKHGVSFEKAAAIFNDPKALTVFDEDHSDDEDRWVTIGVDANIFFVIVSHTYREKNERTAFIRIISARKATKKEIMQYKEGL